jgi:RluA family pseudouridine synthase
MLNMKASLPTSIHRWVVSAELSHLKLVDFLLLQDPSRSATFWRKQIDLQSVWVNVSPARLASRKLEPFDVILYAPFISFPWKILDQNEDFCVLDKPAGQNYEAGKDFLMQTQSNPFPVHRLDMMTTGLLLMARHKQAQEKLVALFKQREMKKAYLAVVWGELKSKSGVIQERLEERASKHGGVIVQVAQGHRGEEAVTHWSCLASKGGLSLLLCEPKTGRTHQIRAHLSHAGLPIVGDRDYLPEKPSRGLRGNIFVQHHLLHAYELSFYWNGLAKSWRSEPNEEMKRIIEMIHTGQIKKEESIQ